MRMPDFYPRPPRGGRLYKRRLRDVLVPISIHALREEGDGPGRQLRVILGNFYPRPPRGGPTISSTRQPMRMPDFYPRPPRGGRLYKRRLRDVLVPISIHALREEGDGPGRQLRVILGNFYPRPPRGGRHRAHLRPQFRERFLSTPSARRATTATTAGHGYDTISIHALREEGDNPCLYVGGSYNQFLSTPSARRATKAARLTSRATRISIHALHEEGDDRQTARL